MNLKCNIRNSLVFCFQPVRAFVALKLSLEDFINDISLQTHSLITEFVQCPRQKEQTVLKSLKISYDFYLKPTKLREGNV